MASLALFLLGDIQTEGKDIVIAMLIVGLIIIGVMVLGELVHHYTHRD